MKKFFVVVLVLVLAYSLWVAYLNSLPQTELIHTQLVLMFWYVEHKYEVLFAVRCLLSISVFYFLYGLFKYLLSFKKKALTSESI